MSETHATINLVTSYAARARVDACKAEQAQAVSDKTYEEASLALDRALTEERAARLLPKWDDVRITRDAHLLAAAVTVCKRYGASIAARQIVNVIDGILVDLESAEPEPPRAGRMPTNDEAMTGADKIRALGEHLGYLGQ